jgi:hypothetical protein
LRLSFAFPFSNDLALLPVFTNRQMCKSERNGSLHNHVASASGARFVAAPCGCRMSKQPDLHRKEARRNGGNLASYDQKPDRRMCVSLPFAFPCIVACAVSMD